MHLLVAHDVLDIAHEAAHVVEGPVVDARKGCQRKGLEPLGHAEVVPSADVLEVRVGRPRAERDLDDVFLDVDEAGPLQHVSGPAVVGERFVDARRGLVEVTPPAQQDRVGLQGAVVAARRHVQLDLLEAAVDRLQVVVNALVDLGPA